MCHVWATNAHTDVDMDVDDEDDEWSEVECVLKTKIPTWLAQGSGYAVAE